MGQPYVQALLWLRLRLWRVAEAPPGRQDPGPPLNAAALAAMPPDALAVRTLGGGDGPGGTERLDNFLARNGVSPANWKAIASLNGIDDPHHMPATASLRLPGGGG